MGKKVFFYYQNQATTLDMLEHGELLLIFRQGARWRIFGGLLPAEEPTSVEKRPGSFPKKPRFAAPSGFRAAPHTRAKGCMPSRFATGLFTKLVSVSQLPKKELDMDLWERKMDCDPFGTST